MHRFDTLFGLDDKVWFIYGDEITSSAIAGIIIYDSGTVYTLKGYSGRCFPEEKLCATREMAEVLLAAQQKQAKVPKYKPGDIVWFIGEELEFHPEVIKGVITGVHKYLPETQYAVLVVPDDMMSVQAEAVLFTSEKEARAWIEKYPFCRCSYHRLPIKSSTSACKSELPEINKKLDKLIQHEGHREVVDEWPD